MSAELLNLLRNGVAPSSPSSQQQQQQQQQEPQATTPASGLPPTAERSHTLSPSTNTNTNSSGHPALDLLFRDLNMSAQAAPISLYSPAPVNQGANLLSLLQGQQQVQEEQRHQHQQQQQQRQSPVPSSEEAAVKVEESAPEEEPQQSEQERELWNMLRGPLPPSDQPTPAEEEPRDAQPESDSLNPQPQAQPVPSPSQSHSTTTNNKTPFDFFTGFDVLAGRNAPHHHHHHHHPPPSKPVMRVSSPLRPASPAVHHPESPPSSQSRTASQPAQQRSSSSSVKRPAAAAAATAVSSIGFPLDSPDSSAPVSPNLPPTQKSVSASRTTGAAQQHQQQQRSSSDAAAADVPDVWLSGPLLDRLPLDPTHVGLPVSSPKYAEQEQALRINIAEPSLDLLYRGRRTVTPITLFQTPHAFSPGRKLDLLHAVLIYATRTGRLRILDRSSGARLLLKGHTGPVTDVCLQPMPSTNADGDGDSLLVVSASVAAPSVILWRVAKDVAGGSNGAYSDMPAGFRCLLQFNLRTPDASVRCIRKLSPDLFALATTDSRLLLLDLASPAWAETLQRDGQKQQQQQTATEEELMSSGLLKQVKFGDPVVDLAVAPDGSAVVVLDAAGHLHVGEVTAERTLKPKRKAPFTPPGLKPEQICLLSYPASALGSPDKGFYVAVSYEQGRVVHLANLQGQVLTSITIAQPDQASPSTPSSFGRLSFNPAYSTLMLSSSLRGSVYSFHVKPTGPAEPSLLGVGGRDLDWLVHAAAAPRPSLPSARIDRMLEVPCPKHTLEFVDATEDPADPSLFCVALDGISQLHIDSSVLDQMAAPVVEEAGHHQQQQQHHADADAPPPATLNFRDAIGVDVEQSVHTDRESQNGSPGPANQRRASLLPSEVTQEPPFISSLKQRTDSSRRRPSSKQQQQQQQPTSGLPTTTTTTTASPAASAPYTPPSSMAEQFSDLEERLFSRVEKLITDREAAAERRSREERAAEQAAEITRQEKLLGMVSQTLGKQTNRTLDQSIRSEIRDSLMPAIAQTVRESVDSEISTVLRNALQRSIPDALSGFFHRPDVTNHLIRSFSSSASPIIERMVQDAIRNTVVPHFTRETQQMVDVLSKQMRGEILNVRKDIEHENNAVIAELSDNIAHLKDMLQQSEARNKAQLPPHQHQHQQPQPQQQQQYSPRQQPRGGAPPAHYSPAAQIQSQQSSRQQQPPSQPSQSQQSVRSSTPASAYEDILLEALASQDDTRLAAFIEDHPDRRIRAIFHSNAGKPPISQPVLLSLMHRLVKPLAQRGGPLDSRDYVRLRWFRACLDGLDYDDDQTANYVPRVLDVTCNALSSAQARLMTAADMQGMNTVNDLVNTLQYLLKSVANPGHA